MRLRIIHETFYAFSKEVFIEPHYLRFKLRNSPSQQLEAFTMNIFPSPAGLSERLDAENNLVHLCWFDGMHNEFDLKIDMIIVADEFNPFNFFIAPSYLTVPFSYDESHATILSPMLVADKIDNRLRAFGNEILAKTKNDTVHFLMHLTQSIHSSFKIIYRETGMPLSADETFQLKYGACRDVTWMQIQLLRNMGIAARFVSGYFFIPEAIENAELHAWLEVYIPGAGWIGLDPSHGILTGSHHIPIASSSNHQLTMPIDGTFRGSAKSTLTSTLKIVLI